MEEVIRHSHDLYFCNYIVGIVSFQMSIASSYSFDVFLVQWDFARTILRLWFVPVVDQTSVINCFCLTPLGHLYIQSIILQANVEKLI